MGYGWQSGPVDSKERVTGTDLTRDLDFAPLLIFAVDVPAGTYEVTLTMGDTGSFAHEQMGVSLEGVSVGTVDTAAGEIQTLFHSGVRVGDGQLTVRLEDYGGSDPNVVINGLEVAWVPDTFGPRVIASDPVGSVLGPVDRITLEFDETVLEGSFTLADVADLAGPNGAITPTAVNRLGAAEYEVVFGPQSEAGDYSLTIGPEITDALGNRMDQDGDGINGEPVEDRYTTAFTLVESFAARYDFGTVGSPVAEGYTQVTPASGYDAALGYGWQSGPIDSVDRATGTALTRDLDFAPLLLFAVDVPTGTYDVTLTVGDVGPYAHEQMGLFLEGALVDTVDTEAGEIQTLLYAGVRVEDGQLTVRLEDLGGSDPNAVISALEVTTGPRVIASSPAGTVVAASVDRVSLSFSEEILDGSFTLADVASLTGPGGPITPTAVNRLGAAEYEVVFASQSEPGDYSLVVGPEILDLSGNAMDQDHDGTNGEPVDDRYTAAFGLVPFAARYDFGTVGSPVAEGYTQVTPQSG
ncbi:MAG: Ig-like domain-containing domain, partial [Planctomycetota bacterium]